ncbi:hypothetical protein K7X08_006953 [Anisodus acutangulus]|uniref:Uncharacterized protein n=1 Tax=Anisodus acutangulus TaxID=402998 RepID=A0A9Q1R145_9SOLA|nr:hypothetical protein K7X08_006953 [Anisodus acutangulus]
MVLPESFRLILSHSRLCSCKLDLNYTLAICVIKLTLSYTIDAGLDELYITLTLLQLNNVKSIIQMAKPKLKPSALALRKGETEESTLREFAQDDSTGVLASVETKIAKATMIPRNHGEIASFLLYLSDVEEGGETMFLFGIHNPEYF